MTDTDKTERLKFLKSTVVNLRAQIAETIKVHAYLEKQVSMHEKWLEEFEPKK